jgi:hypothetical protein
MNEGFSEIDNGFDIQDTYGLGNIGSWFGDVMKKNPGLATGLKAIPFVGTGVSIAEQVINAREAKKLAKQNKLVSGGVPDYEQQIKDALNPKAKKETKNKPMNLAVFGLAAVGLALALKAR